MKIIVLIIVMAGSLPFTSKTVTIPQESLVQCEFLADILEQAGEIQGHKVKSARCGEINENDL